MYLLEIIEQILRPRSYDAKLGHRKFCILILDKTAMKVLNASLALTEVFELGITLVEDLSRNREPMPSMEAIYIISPTVESIEYIIKDYTPKSKHAQKNAYKCANVYFLDPCDMELIEKLAKSPAAKFIKTLIEFNLSFIPLEKQIFAVSSIDVSKTTSGLVSLCSSLNIYPTLRYHSDFARSAEICYRVDQKLKDLQKSQPTMSMDSNAQLIILDRSFDLISPLLHETTFQSMATDLCDFKDGIYRYTGADRQSKVVNSNLLVQYLSR